MRCLPILLLILFVCPGCDGNIGDAFGAFPADVFAPAMPDGGGDGGGPPGGGGGGGGFQTAEVGFLEGAQGVTGDVRNIVLAQVGAQTIAFLAAGTGGVHVADVTQPEMINSRSFLTTIRASVLTTPPAAIAGGRVDALAVVDNAFLVCVAIGTSAANAVTVFHIPTLITAATSSGADLSSAFVPSTAGAIAAPGNAMGKGGGVSGAASTFFVAGGGTDLGIGVILPGTPGTWSALPAVRSSAMPNVDNFVDVLVNLPALYCSVQDGTTFGIIAGTIAGAPPTVTFTTPQTVQVVGANLDIVAADRISGPGNFPLDLAFDRTSLFVGGDDEVQVFSVTNPAVPVRTALAAGTGVNTIALDASAGFFAVGAEDTVRVFTTLAGQPTLTAQLAFTGTFTIRGVALTGSAAGRFVLCCAGTRGMRVVQWSNIP